MMVNEKRRKFGSYRSDIQEILDEFNSSVGGKFLAESRILIPAESQYSLNKRGIIIEYIGKLNEFEEYFEQYSSEICNLAHKLDKRTSLYEYLFMTEFTQLDKWVDYNDTKVAYNLEL